MADSIRHVITSEFETSYSHRVVLSVARLEFHDTKPAKALQTRFFQSNRVFFFSKRSCIGIYEIQSTYLPVHVSLSDWKYIAFAVEKIGWISQ